MKKIMKKGFTIVELVIVIAVIAILTAVLVPTISSVVHKANVSADTQLVRNLNTALKEDEALNGKPKTMQGALDVAAADGYDIAKINAKARDNEILWDSENNVFCYIENGEIKYIPNSVKAEKQLDATSYKLWKIYNEKNPVPETQQTYSIYLGDETVAVPATVTVGIDVGKRTDVQAINYSRPSGATQTVVIRTSSQFTNLVINAPLDDVVHYGNANVVNITAVKFGTYKENGSIGTINIKAGKVEISEEAFIGKIAVDKDATAGDGTVASDVAIVNNGSVFAAEVIEYNATNYEHTASSAESAIIDQVEEEVISSGDNIQVGTAEALMNLAFAQSTGLITGNAGVFDIELTKDIDLTGKTWVPFGAQPKSGGTAFPFSGTIDGKGHKIIGLSRGDFEGKVSANHTTTEISGYTYGFIAVAKGSVTVQNITFDRVDINAPGASVCGVVIGSIGEDIADKAGTDVISSDRALKLINVAVNGKVVAKDKIGGLVGYLYNRLPNTNIENCHVNANLTLTGNGTRANGLFGMISNSFSYPNNSNLSYKANTTITDCSFNGKISMGDTTGAETRISAIAFINGSVSYTDPEGSQNPRSRIYVTNFTVGDSFVLDYSGKTANVTYYDAGSVEKAICK